MEYDFDQHIRRASENWKGDEVKASKIEPAPLPVLPERHKAFEPTQSTSQDWTAKLEALKEKINSGVIVGLIGPRGTGKTQLGICLIKFCCIELGRSAEYKKSFDMFLKIREAMKGNGDSESAVISEFVKPHLLIIDAFEVRSETPFENRVMDNIIDKRYDAMKSTIIISNDTRDGLKKILGESISDRMRETGGTVEMNWNSFRVNKQ